MYKVTDFTLQDIRQGNEAVLQQIYNQNRAKFINFARRYNIGEEDIVDAYQDAYMVFYNNVMNGKLKELTSTVSTYLFSVGKYIIFEKMKKSSKTFNPDFDITLLQKNEVENFDYQEDELTNEQRLLQQHFSTLGKKCQELLILFYYRGFTINDILEHGSYDSVNVIKSSKSRCLKQLKERINLSPKHD